MDNPTQLSVVPDCGDGDLQLRHHIDDNMILVIEALVDPTRDQGGRVMSA